MIIIKIYEAEKHMGMFQYLVFAIILSIVKQKCPKVCYKYFQHEIYLNRCGTVPCPPCGQHQTARKEVQ